MYEFSKTHQTGGGPAFATLGALLVLVAFNSHATTFTVNTLADAGSGSLRDAIDQANRSVGPDQIAFQAGLTGTINLVGGQIDIFDPVQIIGPGATKLAVSGNNATRVFSVYPAIGNPDVFDVSISGLAFSASHSTDEGGAILVGDSNLILSNCEFRNNSALRGGGVYAFPTDGSTSLTITNCLFDSNSATVDGGAFGAQDIDVVSVSNVVATNNTAIRNGGAGFVRAVTTSVSASRFDNNHGATSSPGVGGPSGGGALRIDGSKPTATIDLANIQLNNNTSAFGWGGALSLTVGIATLDRMQMLGNSAMTLGGAVSAFNISMQLNNSTLSGNNCSQSGGAIAFDTSGSLDLVNTTLSGNTSSAGNGGGIYSGSNTSLSVASSTIVGNSANSGGGIRRDSTNASLRNTIVANNTATSGPDLSGNFQPNSSLIKNTSGATLAAGSGNLTSGIDPLLSPLGVYGGPTLSLLPSAASPALNAGDISGIGLPATDQRGLPRIAAGRVDIGAVERANPEDVIFRGVFQ